MRPWPNTRCASLGSRPGGARARPPSQLVRLGAFTREGQNSLCGLWCSCFLLIVDLGHFLKNDDFEQMLGLVLHTAFRLKSMIPCGYWRQVCRCCLSVSHAASKGVLLPTAGEQKEGACGPVFIQLFFSTYEWLTHRRPAFQKQEPRTVTAAYLTAACHRARRTGGRLGFYCSNELPQMWQITARPIYYLSVLCVHHKARQA